jgi:PST family polysaccharide transporter
MNNKKILLVNFSSLSIVQILIYTAPLFYLPYLVRVIGPAKYGAVAFARAIVIYFSLLTDFGIGTYAPGQIAVLKKDKNKLSLFVSSILLLKAFLFIGVFILYMIIVFAVPQFRNEKVLFLLTGTILFVNAFYPNWILQGIEKMQYIAYGSLVGKAVYVVLIYFFIKNASDYIYIPLYLTISTFAGMVFMYYSAYFKGHIRFRRPSLKYAKTILKESLPLFVSNVSTQVYTGIYTVTLGFLTNNTIVGYYSIAEKLTKAFLSIEHQVSTVFYPYIARVIKENKDKAVVAIKKSFSSTLLIGIPAFVFTFFYAENIIQVLFGSKFVQGAVPLKIMSFVFIVSAFSNIASKNILLPLNKRKELMKITIATSIVSIILSFVLIPLFKQNGSALAFVLSELFVAVCLYINSVKIGMNFIVSKKTVVKFSMYFLVLVLTVKLFQFLRAVSNFVMLLIAVTVFMILSFVYSSLFAIIYIGKKDIIV